MTLTSERTVGEIATAHPLATRVFARHGIDFCCGGGKALGAACAARGLDPAVVLAEIARETAPPGATADRWDAAPLPDLLAHIVETFHRPLDTELPRLVAMADKVLAVHHDKDPGMLAGMRDTVVALRDELEPHMQKEERILFPLIAAGHGPQAAPPVAVMRAEHDAVASLLGRLRALTRGYAVPAEACNTWRALWHGLAALERDLYAHIHLENNVLFPRALAGD